MTVRQLHDLVEGNVVGEQEFHFDAPSDVVGVLRSMLLICSEYLKNEGIPISQDHLQLKELTFSYPGAVGDLKVIVGD